jgi:hypothetical protein
MKFLALIIPLFFQSASAGEKQAYQCNSAWLYFDGQEYGFAKTVALNIDMDSKEMNFSGNFLIMTKNERYDLDVKSKINGRLAATDGLTYSAETDNGFAVTVKLSKKVIMSVGQISIFADCTPQ